MDLKWLLLACTIIIGCSVSAYGPIHPRRHGVSRKVKDLEGDRAKYLLPTNVIPTKYDLHLETHIENFDSEDFTFMGTVQITVTYTTLAGETNDNITLHAHDSIEILGAWTILDSATNATTKLNYVRNPDVSDHLTLTLESGTFEDGEYIISMLYSGKHSDDMHGFYRSSYTNLNNLKKWLVVTQFESSDARKAFPCFDEPQYKAMYSIKVSLLTTLVQEQNYKALSNSMLLSSGVNPNDDTLYTFTFEDTPPMSSYLVAFIVTDFVPTFNTGLFGADESKLFKTWGRIEYTYGNQADLSQLVGPLALDTMEKLVGIPFTLKKVDQVGIPDFSAGAMENWGLTTYRERLIFYNPETDPLSTMQSVVTVTTHELAHQWFGDLVTLHWWNDIWLNEGFATYFEYHAVEQFDPTKLNTSTWNIIGQFISDELQSEAFATDSQESARPLTSDVYAPSDIDANFDNIAYSKGGSVLRMWRHILGDEVFYGGLNSYLDTNKLNVGTPEKLIEGFQTALDVLGTGNIMGWSASDVLKDWHIQAGYPVLNVSFENNQINITQNRFLLSSSEASSKANPQWVVPITYSTDIENNFHNTTPIGFVVPDTTYMQTVQGNATWIVINNQQTGYYRVNYNTENWFMLAGVLREDYQKIHEYNRAQLLDDAFNLARSTQNIYLDYSNVFAITKYLVNETELTPWRAALNGYNFLYTKLATDEHLRDLLTKEMTPKITSIYKKLTLNVDIVNDSHTNRLLRSQVASWACKLGNTDCITDATALYGDGSTITKSSSRLVPDVLNTIVCTVIREATENATWTKVWGLYLQSSSNNVLQTSLISALGCSKNPALLRAYLEMTLIEVDPPIRKQDLTAVFSAVHNGNPENVEVALQFLTDKLEDIARIYGGMDPLGGLLTGIASKLSSDDDLKAMQDIKKKIDDADASTPLGSGKTGAETAVNIIQSNKDWMNMKKDLIENALVEATKSGAAMKSIAIVVILLGALFVHYF